MNIRLNKRSLLMMLGFLFVLTLMISSPVESAPPLPGAIFTTVEDGTRVNANIFEEKCDVYLDGGPGPNAPADAAGLPDGDYFFQVTDPSGKILLSTDPVENRQFNVTGGIISGVSGAGNHMEGVDFDQGAATIQLCPFEDTPNPGGVYKVWVTPVDDFVGDPAQVDNPGKFHGFIPAASKTDNFKVGGRGKTPCLTIIKFGDCDEDGIWDLKGKTMEWWEEPELEGWPIWVLDPNGAPINGILHAPVELCNLIPGDYTVTEAIDDGLLLPYAWNCEVTANILDGKHLEPPAITVVVPISNKNRELIFGNICDHH